MNKVLFVDDEKLIINSLKRGLRKYDFECYYALSGKEALRILNNTEIDVVVSDMRMPEMSGLELLRTVEVDYPDVVKIIVSGYAQLPQLIATINQASIFKYLSKPVDLTSELVPAVKEALEYAKFKKESSIRNAALESRNEAYRKIFKTMTSKANTKDQSYDLIRIFTQVVMNGIKDHTKDDQLSVNDKLDLLDGYKSFCDYYLGEIKRNEIYFEPIRIINEIELTLKSEGYNLKIERGIDEDSKALYEGRGMHIKPIIISVINDYIDKKDMGTVKIIASEINKTEGKVNMAYIIESNERIFKDVNLEDYNMRLYRSLLKIFGGDLEVMKTENKVDIVLKVMLFVSDEGESDEPLNS